MARFKLIVSSLALLSVGFISGYFTCKKLLADKYMEDLDELRDIYWKKEQGFQDAEDSDIASEDDEDDDDVNDEETRKYVNGPINQQLYSSEKGQPLVNYSKPSLDKMARAIKKDMTAQGVYDPTAGLEEAEEDEDEEDPSEDLDGYDDDEMDAVSTSRTRMQMRRNDEPYLIDYDEYMDGVPGYDKQTLYYYAQDAVLCEDDDIVVDDEEGLVGLDYEETLRMQTSAWVCNDRTRTLYEIHKIQSSYRADVLGVRETPREREFRLQGRRKQALDNQ